MNVPVFLWTDSEITLAWISTTKKYKKFVASRVEKVKKFKNANWGHVSGTINPSDYATREINASDLINNYMWWSGPSFIREDVNHFDKCQRKFETSVESSLKVLITTEKDSFLPESSSFNKLKRVFVYVLRFIDCFKNKAKKKNGFITVFELRNATKAITKIMQNEHFSEEINMLRNGKSVKKSSAIHNLCPFLDDEGILRVGGRLKNAQIPFDMKHQILLPKTSMFTTLVIREAHHVSLHGDPKITESFVRRKYWVIRSQTAIKKELRLCVTCVRLNPSIMQQFMADLPAARVEKIEKVFLKSAVDYAAPVRVRTSKLRNAKIVKGYIAIFVCMATKAIYIELVGNLTADSFVAALRRFVSRRGYVTDIKSDNGTNFVRTDKILDQLSAAELSKFNTEIHNELLNNISHRLEVHTLMG